MDRGIAGHEGQRFAGDMAEGIAVALHEVAIAGHHVDRLGADRGVLFEADAAGGAFYPCQAARVADFAAHHDVRRQHRDAAGCPRGVEGIERVVLAGDDDRRFGQGGAAVAGADRGVGGGDRECGRAAATVDAVDLGVAGDRGVIEVELAAVIGRDVEIVDDEVARAVVGDTDLGIPGRIRVPPPLSLSPRM